MKSQKQKAAEFLNFVVDHSDNSMETIWGPTAVLTGMASHISPWEETSTIRSCGGMKLGENLKLDAKTATAGGAYALQELCCVHSILPEGTAAVPNELGKSYFFLR